MFSLLFVNVINAAGEKVMPQELYISYIDNKRKALLKSRGTARDKFEKLNDVKLQIGKEEVDENGLKKGIQSIDKVSFILSSWSEFLRKTPRKVRKISKKNTTWVYDSEEELGRYPLANALSKVTLADLNDVRGVEDENLHETVYSKLVEAALFQLFYSPPKDLSIIKDITVAQSYLWKNVDIINEWDQLTVEMEDNEMLDILALIGRGGEENLSFNGMLYSSGLSSVLSTLSFSIIVSIVSFFSLIVDLFVIYRTLTESADLTDKLIKSFFPCVYSSKRISDFFGVDTIYLFSLSSAIGVSSLIIFIQQAANIALMPFISPIYDVYNLISFIFLGKSKFLPFNFMCKSLDSFCSLVEVLSQKADIIESNSELKALQNASFHNPNALKYLSEDPIENPNKKLALLLSRLSNWKLHFRNTKKGFFSKYLFMLSHGAETLNLYKNFVEERKAKFLFVPLFETALFESYMIGARIKRRGEKDKENRLNICIPSVNISAPGLYHKKMLPISIFRDNDFVRQNRDFVANDITICPKKMTAFLGANGSGKTIGLNTPPLQYILACSCGFALAEVQVFPFTYDVIFYSGAISGNSAVLSSHQNSLLTTAIISGLIRKFKGPILILQDEPMRSTDSETARITLSHFYMSALYTSPGMVSIGITTHFREFVRFLKGDLLCAYMMKGEFCRGRYMYSYEAERLDIENIDSADINRANLLIAGNVPGLLGSSLKNSIGRNIAKRNFIGALEKDIKLNYDIVCRKNEVAYRNYMEKNKVKYVDWKGYNKPLNIHGEKKVSEKDSKSKSRGKEKEVEKKKAERVEGKSTANKVEKKADTV